MADLRSLLARIKSPPMQPRAHALAQREVEPHRDAGAVGVVRDERAPEVGAIDRLRRVDERRVLAHLDRRSDVASAAVDDGVGGAAEAGDGVREVDETRARERMYTGAGIHSVPAIIIDNKHLISGGQPAEIFERALRQIAGAAPQQTAEA